MEKRSESDMTREEKIDVLHIWCAIHPCDSKFCRIYDICHRHSGSWDEQPDDVIDKVFEALWEGHVDPQCEIKIENIKELMEEGYPASKEEIKAALLKSQEAKADEMEEVIGYLKDEMKRQLVEGVDISTEFDSQEAKADAGKLPMNLVPTQIVRDIAEVRQYGNEKYGDPNNWRKVEKLRYVAALERHLLAYKDYLNGDDDGLDKESEIEHHKHMACNMAFICEMERWEKEDKT